MSYKKENPVKQKGGKKIENPLRKSGKGKGSEFTGPHASGSYVDENPYSGGKKFRKAKGSAGKKGKKGKKGY